MSPASIRSVVVLPAPLGPSRAKISPGSQLERDIIDRDTVAEVASEMLRGQRLRSHEGEVDDGRVNGDRIRSSPASRAGGRCGLNERLVGLMRPAAWNCTVRILSPSLS